MNKYEEALEALELRRTPSLFEILDSMEWCYYCGMPATTIDHTVPQSFLLDLADMPDVLRKVKQRRRLAVPACKECNSLMGNLTYNTLAAKKEALKVKLGIRYKRLLDLPIWSHKELSQIGPALRSRVMHGLNMKRLIKARLRW